MAEGSDPSSSFSSIRSSPKDIQLMGSILKEMDVTDYEPRVLNQMVEFSYRYMSTILDDAFLYSTHAKKKSVDSEDVKLAINLHQERVLAAPPSKDVILEVAKQRNSLPLPQIKSTAGLRLPPDRHSLTSCNYRLKSKKKVHTVSRLNVTGSPSNLGNKNAALANVNKSPSILPKGSPNLSPIKPVVSSSKSVSSPNIKVPDGKGNVVSSSSPTPPASSSPSPQLLVGSSSSLTSSPSLGSSPTSTTQILMPVGSSTPGTPQMLLPTTGVASVPQINMPTVTSMPSEGKEEPIDDDYDMID